MHRQQTYLSPELVPRLAAIDVGTNSLRLIIAEGLRDGKYRVLDDEKETTRLGRNLAASGFLDPTAVEASLAALRRMKQIADGFQVQRLRAIATCAVREAQDGPAFCRRVREEIGIDIEVVDAREEARLAFTSVAANFDLAGKRVAVADMGGGSTEIVLASDQLIEDVYTTPLGAVRLTEQFGSAQQLTLDDFVRLQSGVERLLRKHTPPKPLFRPHLLIGSGGTFTALATMLMAAKGQSGLPIRGYAVSRADLRHLLERLRKLTPKARRGVPGLSPDRADIIVAGLTVIDSLMQHFELNTLQVHDGGVRDGLLRSLVREWSGTPGQAPVERAAAVEHFAARCGVDLGHCRHVARLAGSLFEQLLARVDMPPSDRSLLETAALLQDVGYLIDYEQHHKHSYHLILNSHLPDFQPRELELVANVARYHRGSRPKKKHAAFARLKPEDRRRVRRLAAILRLAGGFDRSHSQQVQGLVLSGEGDQLVVRVVAEALPEVDLWGARRRAAIFEREFESRLEIEWQPWEPTPSASGETDDPALGATRPAVEHPAPPASRPAKPNGQLTAAQQGS